MTRETAIEILKELWRTKYPLYLESDIRKALDMAIKAISQGRKGRGMTDQTLKDIDRAFKALEERDELLDKIRAEIEGLTYYWCEVNPKSVIDDALHIIDKYRNEGSDKE